MRHYLPSIIRHCCLLSALGACSVEPVSPPREEQHHRQGSFSAEDKRIARMLAIGSEMQLPNRTPQFEAMLCSLALTDISSRLQNTDAIPVEQRKAFERAQAMYRQRATAGLSAEENEKTRRDVEATYPEQGDRVRFAVECLRKLVATS